jgi:predicted aconitase with swiveling domain
MDVIVDADVLVDGTAKGDILKLSAPISFWGGIDPMAGKIANPQHPDHGALVTGKVLAIPRIIGSSSSSQLLLELLYRQTGPAAILLGAFDAIIGIAPLVGREMTFGSIPILRMSLDQIETGMKAEIEPGGRLSLTSTD